MDSTGTNGSSTVTLERQEPAEDAPVQRAQELRTRAGDAVTDVGTRIGTELGAELGKELRESALLLGLALVVVGLVAALGSLALLLG